MLFRYCLKKSVTENVGYKENDALKNKTVQCRKSSTKVLHIALGLAFKTIFHWLHECSCCVKPKTFINLSLSLIYPKLPTSLPTCLVAGA